MQRALAAPRRSTASLAGSVGVVRLWFGQQRIPTQNPRWQRPLILGLSLPYRGCRSVREDGCSSSIERSSSLSPRPFPSSGGGLLRLGPLLNLRPDRGDLAPGPILLTLKATQVDCRHREAGMVMERPDRLDRLPGIPARPR